MDGLLQAATDLAALLPASRIKAIADRLRDMAAPESSENLHHLVNAPNTQAVLDQLIVAWKQAGVSGEVLAGILMAASVAHRRAQSECSVELVWTGPTTPFVPTRRTEQVLLDLIGQARNDLFLVSFVAYAVPSVVGALNAATARNVDVRILLETSKGRGGSLAVDPIETMRRNVPAASLYSWAERSGQFIDGRVHAKVAVADGNAAFLTSANLTGHALEKNMEAGVVIIGGDVPRGLSEHLMTLIDTKVIREVQPA